MVKFPLFMHKVLEQVKWWSPSHVWLCNPWTLACWTPQSMKFSGQEYWSGLSFPSPLEQVSKTTTSQTGEMLFDLNRNLIKKMNMLIGVLESDHLRMDSIWHHKRSFDRVTQSINPLIKESHICVQIWREADITDSWSYWKEK